MILVFAKAERSLTTFPSDYEVKGQCEAIDVENGEYEFCDDEGQIYTHVIVKKPVLLFFAAESFDLVPAGSPDVQNASRLIDEARTFEGGRCGLVSVDELKMHILKRRGAT